jgi:type IV pilus assembly protein PilN
MLRKNDQVQSSIADIAKQIANHADVKNQLKDLRDREDAIAQLQAARTGPTAAMLELSRILTPGRGPTTDRDKMEQLKRDDPGAVPNPNWDPRRLWLTTYSDTARSVKLSGLARDGEDVSEFLRRLTLSDYFYDLKLLPASKEMDSVTHLELVKFELSAKVRY